MKYLCYEKMAEKQSFCDVFFFAWCTSVGFQTLYLFVSCFKNAYTTWLDCKVMERRHDVFHNILFFPDRRLVCRDFFSQFGCRVKKCRNAHYKTSLSELLDVLNNAKKSLDICMFTISCHELANAALELHKLDIAVRIITNEEHESLSGSQIERFQREGIQVRHDKTSYYMHHKFVIVDNVTLITGSFNWTRQAVVGNRENVLVTNNDEIVQPYIQEFKKLWEMYNPRN